MLRWCLFLLVSAASVSAQIRWKCDPKDGKFITSFGRNGRNFYCWDGQIFSEEAGYTPPPGYVLAYWEEVHRKSAQIRADIARKGQELKDQAEKAKQDSARLNQERAKSHAEYMADLNRRVAESKAHAGRPYSTPVATTLPPSGPRTQIVMASDTPAPALPPVSRTKVGEIQVGMDRAAVEAILGKPHGSMTVPEDDKLIESLTYTLDDRGTARVRMENGKVASVKISE